MRKKKVKEPTEKRMQMIEKKMTKKNYDVIVKNSLNIDFFYSINEKLNENLTETKRTEL